MSFEEQERVLFDLLFDQALRENFCRESVGALSAYELSQHELEDFKTIRPDALKIDAEMRRFMVLGYLAKSLPLTFALVSSLNKGTEALEAIVDLNLMKIKPADRVVQYAQCVREWLGQQRRCATEIQSSIEAVVEAEMGMAWTASLLKGAVLDGNIPQESDSESMGADWELQPIKLAPYVSAAVIPKPYQTLKTQLCLWPDSELWPQLSKSPLAVAKRDQLLQHQTPRLMVARARIEHLSYCDPTISHQTAELSEGFAPLFQYVNGTASVSDILLQLSHAGAPTPMLESVKESFSNLLKLKMLAH